MTDDNNIKNKTPKSAKKLANKAKNLRISTNKLYRFLQRWSGDLRKNS